jgi:hypothetical protein
LSFFSGTEYAYSAKHVPPLVFNVEDGQVESGSYEIARSAIEQRKKKEA